MVHFFEIKKTFNGEWPINSSECPESDEVRNSGVRFLSKLEIILMNIIAILLYIVKADKGNTFYQII